MAGEYRDRLTFSNVVSVISLLFALGLGSAWAATELEKNEVKSKHIGKGQVKNSDLANNSVTSPKVADGSLLSADFGAGQLPAGPQGERGPQGEQGLQGERGLQGETGTRGPAGATNVQIRSGSTGSCTTEGCEASANAPCQAGERAVGGGGSASLEDDFSVSIPAGGSTLSNPDRWSVVVSDERGDADAAAAVIPYVVCASP